MSKKRHDSKDPASSPATMIIMAVCALAVVALVVWALTRTVDPTTAESPQAAAFPTAEPPAAIPTAPTATTAQTTADPTATSADIHPETGVPRISVEDFRPKYDAGSVVVIDVRDANSYAVGHIPGAMNIPMASIQSFTDMIPKGKEIVTYCTWPNEESSAGAALILQNSGFNQVSALYGGFDAWRDRGWPVETGGPR